MSLKRSTERSSQPREEIKAKTQKNLKSLAFIVIAVIKYSPSPRQITINLHTKGLFLLPDTIAFNKILQACLKLEKTETEETKQSSEPDAHMPQMLELSDIEFKIIMINTLKLFGKYNTYKKRWVT